MWFSKICRKIQILLQNALLILNGLSSDPCVSAALRDKLFKFSLPFD
jgi:hypothetical protein